MIDWDLILDDLNAMDTYFEKCEANAARDSEALRRFAQYRETLLNVSKMVLEKIAEEDDGK